MNVEEKIRECESILKQTKYFDPDPYYVNYFFNLFINSSKQVYDEIFEEANTGFGLFVDGSCNKEKFLKKAKEKNDEKALEFVNWFEKKFEMEHELPYPDFIKSIMELKMNGSIPEIKIMMRTIERYSEDIFLEIKVNLKNNKLRSKEELEIEIKRNLPVFLEVINNKRMLKNEPKVTQKEVTVSAFMKNKLDENFEIVYASELYIPVLKRIFKESYEKIQEMSRWN